MNLRSVWKALQHRWWVAVPVLLLTLGGVFWAGSEANAEYEATSILLLADPQIVGNESQAPSEVDTGRILSIPVLVEVVLGDGASSILGSDIRRADYTITDVGEGVLRIEAASASGGSVVAVASRAVAEVEKVVQELDTADDRHTAEMRVLSEPRIARERTTITEDGAEIVESYATGSVQVIITPDSLLEQSPYTASAGTLRVIEEATSTPAVTETVRERVDDPSASFELVFELRDAAPIVHVVATASTPETTMETLNVVLETLDADLEARQELTGAEESTWIQFQRLAMPVDAEIPEGSLRRPIVTIIALGLIAAVTLAVLVDSLMSPPRDPGVKFRKHREGDEHAEEDVQSSRAS